MFLIIFKKTSVRSHLAFSAALYNITFPFFEKCFQKTVLSVVYVSIRNCWMVCDKDLVWKYKDKQPIMLKTFAYCFTDYLLYVLTRKGGGGKFNFCASVTIACAPPD
jgi:hypothetical protein